MTERSWEDLIGRLERLLPAPVRVHLRSVDEHGDTLPLIEGTFPLARLEWNAAPFGDAALVLQDSARIRLPRDSYSGHDLGPDHTGAVQLEVHYPGVMCTLGVSPA